MQCSVPVDMSSDDEFEVDFVSNASKNVKKKWTKVHTTSGKKGKGSSVCDLTSTGHSKSVQKSKASKKGKENLIRDEDEDVEVITNDQVPGGTGGVSLTPPGSPTGNTPTVRGANRSKKAAKALEALKRQNNGSKNLQVGRFVFLPNLKQIVA